MSSEASMATPLNGRTHTTPLVDQDTLAATTNSVDMHLLNVNGASLEDSNSSCVSDDEVLFLLFQVSDLEIVVDHPRSVVVSWYFVRRRFVCI